jgi:hypothetical protein
VIQAFEGEMMDASEKEICRCEKTLAMLRKGSKKLGSLTDYRLLQTTLNSLIVMGLFMLAITFDYCTEATWAKSTRITIALLSFAFFAVWVFLVWRIRRAKVLFDSQKPQNLSELR